MRRFVPDLPAGFLSFVAYAAFIRAWDTINKLINEQVGMLEKEARPGRPRRLPARAVPAASVCVRLGVA